MLTEPRPLVATTSKSYSVPGVRPVTCTEVLTSVLPAPRSAGQAIVWVCGALKPPLLVKSVSSTISNTQVVSVPSGLIDASSSALTAPTLEALSESITLRRAW